MNIHIKENNRTKIFLWFPSNPTILNLILRVAVIEGTRFPKATREKIIAAYKKLGKIHKSVLLIETDSASGEKVFIKI